MHTCKGSTPDPENCGGCRDADVYRKSLLGQSGTGCANCAALIQYIETRLASREVDKAVGQPIVREAWIDGELTILRDLRDLVRSGRIAAIFKAIGEAQNNGAI